MPVPLRFYGTAGQVLDVTLDNTFDGETFQVNVPFTIQSFDFDPDVHLISKNNSTSLGTTSVNQLARVKLFPNPSASALQVLLPSGVSLKSAIFHNQLGQVVLKTDGQTTWDVSKLASGVHFVTLETDAGSRTLKFIKE